MATTTGNAEGRSVEKSKAQAVRDYIAEHPRARNTVVAAALSEPGINVTAEYVSKVKSRSKKVKTKTRKSTKPTYPRHSIDKVLRIPKAVLENNAGKSCSDRDAAKWVGVGFTGPFQVEISSAIKFNLLHRPGSGKLALTNLARKILRPQSQDDELQGLREAVLIAPTVGDVYRHYTGKTLPDQHYFDNALVDTFGIPQSKVAEFTKILLDSLLKAQLIEEDDGKRRLILTSQQPRPSTSAAEPPAKRAGSGGVRTEEHVPTLPETTEAAAVPDSAKSDTSLLRRGLQIDAYRLKESLGRGFSAQVWSATVQRAIRGVDIEKGQEVAMKFYHPHAMAIPDQVLRVEREYRIAQTIRHPHLIRIYEFMLASPRPNHNFLVMDIAKGQLLSELITAKAVPVEAAPVILAQLLSGLDQLHLRGALHRDVKPSNIAVSLDKQPTAVLLDLGIVSIVHEKGVTAGSQFVGSKHWAPFEQLVGKPLDPRSDLYSIGAALYNLLTGNEPYGDSPTEAAVAVEMQKSPLVIPSTPGLHSDIVEMLNACLSHDIAQRPSRAQECLDVLNKHKIAP